MSSSLRYNRLRPAQFLGLSTFQFLAYFRRSLFYGFVTVYLGKVLLLSTTEVTLMATIGMIANVGSQTLAWGPLLDRLKRSVAFVIIGEFLAGIGHIALFWWHVGVLETGNLRYAGYTIIIGLAIIEIFWSQSNIGWSALISELTDEDERKKLVSQLSIIGGIGGIFGATTGGFLYLGGDGFQNGNLFYLPAAVMVISSIIVYFTIKDTPRTDKEGIGAINESNKPSSTVGSLPRPMLRLFVLFLIALVFINFGRNSIALISVLYIVDPSSYGASDLQLALFRNVQGAASMMAGLVLGTILARSKDERVMFAGTLFAISSIAWFIISPTYELVLISAALIGATQVVLQASSYAIIAKIIPPEFRGRLFAWYNASFFLSWGVAGTLITGPIADYTVSLGYSFAFAYQMSFLAAIILVIIGIGFLIYFFGKLRKYEDQLI